MWAVINAIGALLVGIGGGLSTSVNASLAQVGATVSCPGTGAPSGGLCAVTTGQSTFASGLSAVLDPLLAATGGIGDFLTALGNWFTAQPDGGLLGSLLSIL